MSVCLKLVPHCPDLLLKPGHPPLVRVEGDRCRAQDGHLDPVFVVILLALGLRDEVEHRVLDAVKLPPEHVRVLVEQGSEVARFETDQIARAVVEQGDPLKPEPNESL